MKLQTAFNKVYKWLTRDGFKQCSDRIWKTCILNDGNGNACAVGCLIPKKLWPQYKDDVGDLGEISELLKLPEDFLVEVQNVHDFSDDRYNSKTKRARKLKAVAKAYGLTVPE